MFDRAGRLEKAFRRFPRAPLFARLADEYLRKGRMLRAQVLCEEGCERFPRYPTGFFVLSRCYEEQKLWEEARSALDRGLRLDPDNPAGFRRLSAIYRQLGNGTLALKCLQKAAALDPLSDTLEQELARLALHTRGQAPGPSARSDGGRASPPRQPSSAVASTTPGEGPALAPAVASDEVEEGLFDPVAAAEAAPAARRGAAAAEEAADRPQARRDAPRVHGPATPGSPVPPAVPTVEATPGSPVPPAVPTVEATPGSPVPPAVPTVEATPEDAMRPAVEASPEDDAQPAVAASPEDDARPPDDTGTSPLEGTHAGPPVESADAAAVAAGDAAEGRQTAAPERDPTQPDAAAPAAGPVEDSPDDDEPFGTLHSMPEWDETVTTAEPSPAEPWPAEPDRGRTEVHQGADTDEVAALGAGLFDDDLIADEEEPEAAVPAPARRTAPPAPVPATGPSAAAPAADAEEAASPAKPAAAGAPGGRARPSAAASASAEPEPAPTATPPESTGDRRTGTAAPVGSDPAAGQKTRRRAPQSADAAEPTVTRLSDPDDLELTGLLDQIDREAGAGTPAPAQGPVPTVTLAELYNRQGFPERALEIYEQVLSRDPDNEAARRGAAALTAT